MDRYHHTPCVDVCTERGEAVEKGEAVWGKRKGFLRRGVCVCVWGGGGGTSVTHYNDWENNDENEQVKPQDPNRVLLLHNP